MTQGVLKYPIPVGDIVHARMPIGARILHVGVQDDSPEGPIMLWALAEPNAPHEERTFRVLGTGETIPDVDSLYHRGTVIAFGGKAVWHVFERVHSGSPEAA